MIVTYCDDTVTKEGCDGLERPASEAGGHAGFLVKGEAVSGVHNRGYARHSSGNSSDKSGLGRMGMDEIEVVVPEEPVKTTQTNQITHRADTAPYYVQRDYSHTLPLKGASTDGIGGEDLNLPAEVARHFDKTKNNGTAAAPLRISDNVQDSHELAPLTRSPESLPRKPRRHHDDPPDGTRVRPREYVRRFAPRSGGPRWT